jgi:hypothetical protein
MKPNENTMIYATATRTREAVSLFVRLGWSRVYLPFVPSVDRVNDEFAEMFSRGHRITMRPFKSGVLFEHASRV